ncbi:hypothetical protein FKM82_020041 [Ascaphus truei]
MEASPGPVCHAVLSPGSRGSPEKVRGGMQGIAKGKEPVNYFFLQRIAFIILQVFLLPYYNKMSYYYLQDCTFFTRKEILRLHARYYELAPNLVPMDYTEDPDVRLPFQLIVSMPELMVRVDDLVAS